MRLEVTPGRAFFSRLGFVAAFAFGRWVYNIGGHADVTPPPKFSSAVEVVETRAAR
jgi:hypothetical protein